MKRGKYSRPSSGGLSRVLGGLFLLLFLVLGTLTLGRLLGQEKEAQALEQLQEQVNQETETSPAPTLPEETGIQWTGDSMLSRYAPLHAENPDLFGWLSIDGTRIDYPVMHTPQEPRKYLHRDFGGQEAYAGLPFLDEANGPDSHQLLIYGHNMANGSMFHDLFQYASRDFWEAHREISLDTLYGSHEFEVVAAFYDRVYLKTDEVFKFYQFNRAETEGEYREAVDYYRANSLYDTGITPEYGDQLLALVTCAYHVEDGRFVVIARQKKTPDP